MKTRSLYALWAAGGAVLLALAAPRSTPAQNPPELSPQAAALINDLAVQARQLTENQALIDAKVNKIAEAVRQARLYAARAGKGASK